MPLPEKVSWSWGWLRKVWRSSRAHPMSVGRQAWGAWIGTLECSLWLCRDCPAGHSVCGCGAHYGRQARSSRHQEAAGPSAVIRKGRASQITLNQRHLTVSASPLIAFRKAPPPHLNMHTHFLDGVIIAIASLDFHSQTWSCTACLLMRNPSHDLEVLFNYLIIYSAQHV